MKLYLLIFWLFFLGLIFSLDDPSLSFTLLVIGVYGTFWIVIVHRDDKTNFSDFRKPSNALRPQSTRKIIATEKESKVTLPPQAHKAKSTKEPTLFKKTEYAKEIDIDYENYSDGHSEKEWHNIGFKISDKYKKQSAKTYSFREVEPYNFTSFSNLTKNQRKVKILGYALVSKTGSKKISRDILIKYYKFRKSTAEYAVGYEGYHDW